ncbi:MAG: hypothetical protein ACI4UH_06185 [Dorea sp.]
MINALSVERINAVAPYKVEMDLLTGSYDFVTDFGVHITIYFDEDMMITLHITCIKDEDGIPNFAALIIRNDNPLIVEIVSEFVETAKVLQQKL